jgi:hypothetical protein
MNEVKGTELLTTIGRIVWGHPTKPSPIIEQDGPRKGQPKLDQNGQPKTAYSFGVAFPKAEFESMIWPAMYAEALKGFPNGVPQGFAWKYKDGNSVDRKGKLYSEREGYAGSIVLTFTSNLPNPPPCYVLAGAAYRQMAPNEIKVGDYIRVKTSMKVNVATGVMTSGLYVNPETIEFIGYGQEIVNTPQIDPTAVFGGNAVALPPGASAQPVAPAGGFNAPMAAPMQAAMQPAMQPPMGAPMAAPAPAYDVVQQAGYGGQMPGQFPR